MTTAPPVLDFVRPFQPWMTQCEEMLSRFARTDEELERVVRVVTQTLEVSKMLYDGIHRCVLNAK